MLTSKVSGLGAKIAFFGWAGQTTSYRALNDAMQSSAILKAIAGRKIAIITESSWFAAHAIAICAGAVESLLLCPADISESLREEFLEKSGTEVVITDRELSSPGKAQLLHTDVAGILTTDGKSAAPPLDTNWFLTTSGTTNTPKLIAHTQASLTWSAGNRASAHPVWALCYGVTRFSGLQVLFESLLSGASLAIPSEGASLGEQILFFAECGCDYFSATPSYWRKVLMCPESSNLMPRQITLGGEIADESILKALAAHWPHARLIHIFASTETGVGFSVKDGKSGFPEDYLSSPPKGVQVAISEAGLLLLKSSAMGTKVAGATNDTEDGFINTGDLVERRDGRVYFLGRDSGAINVGGNKVIPEDVERVLCEYPGILAARVHGRKSSMMGALVEALIVQEAALPKDSERVKAIKQYCAEKLQRYKIPAVIEFVDTLPLNRSGKQVRHD